MDNRYAWAAGCADTTNGAQLRILSIELLDVGDHWLVEWSGDGGGE